MKFNWRRPLGLAPLMKVVGVLFILTAMLMAMIYKRVRLLGEGREILLKTAPVDPRDLLRGHYVRLAYDISSIIVDDLERPPSAETIKKSLRRNRYAFVGLRRGPGGFFHPVSISPTMPVSAEDGGESANGAGAGDSSGKGGGSAGGKGRGSGKGGRGGVGSGSGSRSGSGSGGSGIVYLRGRIMSGNCLSSGFRKYNKCRVNLHYGLEKYFVERKKARRLEALRDMTRADDLDARERQLRLSLTILGQRLEDMKRRAGPSAIYDHAEKRRLQAELERARKELAALEKERAQAAAGADGEVPFAVIVRVGRKSGEGAIAGLMLGGRKIYEESLF
jgi:uncharacterized membrane-anchored protein